MRHSRRMRGGWWLTAAGALLLSTLTLVACTESSADDARWVFPPDKKKNKVAVVFVHGILGSSTRTWSQDNGPSFFDYVKQDAEAGSKSDMFAFGYSSKMVSQGSLGVLDAANSLHNQLSAAKVLDYPVIVFAAHSMGGLVTLRYLVSHPEIRARVPAVVLYAVPQQGAAIADVARMFSPNPGLQQLSASEQNDFLRGLEEDWVRLQKPPHAVKVHCAYETVLTYSVSIVPAPGARRFCTEGAIAVGGADHLNIVKPDRPMHDSVLVLINALREVMRDPKTPVRSVFSIGRIDAREDYVELLGETTADRRPRDIGGYRVCQVEPERCCTLPQGTQVKQGKPLRIFFYNKARANAAPPELPPEYAGSPICDQFSIGRNDQIRLETPRGRWVETKATRPG